MKLQYIVIIEHFVLTIRYLNSSISSSGAISILD